MEKPLKNTPVFGDTDFRRRTGGWRQAGATGRRIIVEWSTGTGPRVFVYPAGRRSEGVLLTEEIGGDTSDERWADYLEFQYIPRVVESLQRDDFRTQVICVDLSPLQTQRVRRRAIEAAGRAKSSATH